MPPTRARRIRRADRVIAYYLQHPTKAMQACYKEYGKDKFKNALKFMLTDHSLKIAVKLALRDCSRF